MVGDSHAASPEGEPRVHHHPQVESRLVVVVCLEKDSFVSSISGRKRVISHGLFSTMLVSQ